MTTSHRAYLPLTAQQLQQLLDGGVLAADGDTCFTTTSELIARVGGDEEDQEYAASQDAALAAATTGAHVVAAVDLEPGRLSAISDPSLPDSAVSASGEVELRRIASFHLLDPVGERDVDAEFELSWYDVTELPLVLHEVNSRN